MRAVPGDETRRRVPSEQEQADGPQLVVPRLHQQVVQGPPGTEGDRPLCQFISQPWTMCACVIVECCELSLYDTGCASCLNLYVLAARTAQISCNLPSCGVTSENYMP